MALRKSMYVDTTPGAQVEVFTDGDQLVIGIAKKPDPDATTIALDVSLTQAEVLEFQKAVRVMSRSLRQSKPESKPEKSKK